MTRVSLTITARRQPFFGRPLLLFLFLLWMLGRLLPAWAQPAAYTVAIVPQFSQLQTHNAWSPLLEYLEAQTGHPFELLLYEDFPAFEQSFINGIPDFVYLNPYHAVMAKRSQGYVPLVRDGAHNLTGIIVSRKDSAYTNIQDLQGHKIAFPSQNAFGASLLPRTLLREKEKIAFEPVYAGSHNNALRHVLLGKAAAAGVVYRTLNTQRSEVLDGLRVIYETPPSPSHPLVGHPRLGQDMLQRVRDLILEMPPPQQDLLARVHLQAPVAANYDQDYRFLEEMIDDRYVMQGGKR